MCVWVGVGVGVLVFVYVGVGVVERQVQTHVFEAFKDDLNRYIPLTKDDLNRYIPLTKLLRTYGRCKHTFSRRLKTT